MSASARVDPLALVEQKVAQGERLSAADGVALFESADLLRVGGWPTGCAAARWATTSTSWSTATSTTPTSAATAAPSAPSPGTRARPAPTRSRWTRSWRRRARPSAREPPRSTSWGERTRRCPTCWSGTWWRASARWRPSVHIKAFTASEIAFFAETERLTVEEVLLGPQGGRPGQPARRRRGDPAGRGARPGVPGQDLRREVAGDPPAGSRPGPEDQRHHALRPRGELRRPRRPPDPAARGPGRDRRLSGLHPAGLSTQEQRARRTCPDPPGSTTSRSWPSRA